MTKHSKLSPSSAKVWINCPPSAVLADKLTGVTDYGSEASEEGTRLHKIAAEALRERIPVSEVDKKVSPFVHYVRSLANLIGGKVTHATLETTVDISSLLEGCYGTPDVILWIQVDDKTQLHCIDLKTGFLTVDAEENEQLFLYAEAARREVKGADSLFFHIHQDGRHKMWELTTEFKYKTEGALQYVYPRMFTNDYNFGKHCRFCKAFSICPVAQAKVNEFHSANSGTFSDWQRLEEMLYISKVLEKNMANVKARLETEIKENGYKPQYFKTFEKKKAMKWKPESAKALESHPLKDTLYKTDLVSITEARKILSDSELLAYVTEPETFWEWRLL